MRRAARACSALALALGLARSAAAEVIVDETRRHYVLDASDLPQLAAQLATRRAPAAHGAGARSHGLTEAGLETRYELDPRADGRCALRRIEVRVHLSQTLPEWRPAQAPAEGMAAPVARMLEGLAAHEAGHRRHVLAAAAAIDRRLAALGPAESCERARRAAERAISRELIRLQVNENNYDRATDRGRRQGAVLELDAPLPRPPRERRD